MRTRLSVIAGCLVLLLAILAWLHLRDNPRSQRFVLANSFEDARCEMEFFDTTRTTILVRKGERRERLFKAPKIGFVLMRCDTPSGPLYAPAHFHLKQGRLTEAEIKPRGVIEIRYPPVSS